MRRRSKRSGSVMIEFGVTMLFLVPLLLGISSIGLKIGHSIQITQLTRDIGHMYCRWVDFSTAGAQSMVTKLTAGMDFSSTGKGVIILSQIRRISAQDCTDGGYSSTSNCPNYDQYVVTHRLVFGNSSVATSKFATPTSSIITSNGTITLANYLSNTTVRASSFGNLIALSQGDMSYVVETNYKSFDLFNASAQVPLYTVSAF